jgi:hypothetical protein
MHATTNGDKVYCNVAIGLATLPDGQIVGWNPIILMGGHGFPLNDTTLTTVWPFRFENTSFFMNGWAEYLNVAPARIMTITEPFA